MFSRSLSLLFFIIFTGVLLASCAKPEDSTATSVQLKKGQMTLEENETNPVNPPATSNTGSGVLGEQTDTTQTQPVPPQKGPTMKTLQDFTPIAATTATLHTNKGDITIELYRDKAPLTTLNFLTLAQSGFYDGVVFHRVIEDFMAQVGDPKSKDPALKAEWGTGGPGYTITDEFGAGLVHDSAGIVSMANAGPNSGGSQFFITFGPTEWLDDKHAIFGKVTSGIDVVNSLEIGDVIKSVSLK